MLYRRAPGPAQELTRVKLNPLATAEIVIIVLVAVPRVCEREREGGAVNKSASAPDTFTFAGCPSELLQVQKCQGKLTFADRSI